VKDLAEIPANVKSGLAIIPVARMDDVLKHALTRMPEPITWDEEAEEAAAAARAAAAKADESPARAH
jgi:ATP-dependent Lon protease